MIRVTDHAVVRYLERIVGLDIDNIRREIEESLGSPLAKRLIDFSGGAECRIKTCDVVYCLRGKTVTTCIERGKGR